MALSGRGSMPVQVPFMNNSELMLTFKSFRVPLCVPPQCKMLALPRQQKLRLSLIPSISHAHAQPLQPLLLGSLIPQHLLHSPFPRTGDKAHRPPAPSQGVSHALGGRILRDEKAQHPMASPSDGGSDKRAFQLADQVGRGFPCDGFALDQDPERLFGRGHGPCAEEVGAVVGVAPYPAQVKAILGKSLCDEVLVVSAHVER